MSMSPEELAQAFAQLAPEQQALFQQQLQAMQAQQAAQQAQSQHQAPLFAHTEGGAVVQGSVLLGSGHFVGRDWNQMFVNLYGPNHHTQAQLVNRYLAEMVQQFNVLDLARIHDRADGRDGEPLKLGELYVPLDTTYAIEEGSTLEMALRAPLLAERSAKMADKMRPTPVMAALHHHADMMLIGEAGSGKSTVGHCTFMALAKAGMGEPEALASLADGSRPWPHGTLVPWVLVLRRFAAWLGQREPTEASVWNYWETELNGVEPGQGATLLASLKALSERQGAWVLMDGLDECGSPQAQERVKRALHLFKRSVSRQSWRMLTTARPSARPADATAEHGVYTLAPLSSAQRSTFVRGWYRVQAARGWVRPADAEKLAQDLIQSCRRKDIAPLAQRPLMLTLMALIHGNDRGHLPDDRVDLFEQAVQLLLQRWNTRGRDSRALQELLNQASAGSDDTLKVRDLERKLCELAFTLHKSQQGQIDTGDLPAADIGEAQLCRHLQSLLGPNEALARQVVQHMEEGSGLLVGKGFQLWADALNERRFAFPHRLFQEFLAAKWLSQRADYAMQCKALADSDAVYWHEALAMAGRLANADTALGAAHALVGRTGPSSTACVAEAQLSRALVAAAQIAERGPRACEAEEGGPAVVGHVREWLQAAARPLHPTKGGMKARDRVRAADALGKLGDPRFAPNRFYLPADDSLGFVRIPSNPQFIIGTHPDDGAKVKQATGYAPPDYELNLQPSPHREFWVAKYPVTVAQFRAYCEAAQVQPGDPDALRGEPHHPVVWVSWGEAAAYARWLTQQLQMGPLKDQAVLRNWPARWHIALPSELEWEAAARAGQARRIFPWMAGVPDEWDVELVNAEISIWGTSPVGSYPPNAAGLYDMAGNVFELTRSRWAPDGQEEGAWAYPYREGEPGREVAHAASELMVVRGGSFHDHRRRANCGCRYSFLPRGRDDSLGFRVVVVFSPV